MAPMRSAAQRLDVVKEDQIIRFRNFGQVHGSHRGRVTKKSVRGTDKNVQIEKLSNRQLVQVPWIRVIGLDVLSQPQPQPKPPAQPQSPAQPPAQSQSQPSAQLQPQPQSQPQSQPQLQPQSQPQPQSQLQPQSQRAEDPIVISDSSDDDTLTRIRKAMRKQDEIMGRFLSKKSTSAPPLPAGVTRTSFDPNTTSTTRASQAQPNRNQDQNQHHTPTSPRPFPNDRHPDSPRPKAQADNERRYPPPPPRHDNERQELGGDNERQDFGSNHHPHAHHSRDQYPMRDNERHDAGQSSQYPNYSRYPENHHQEQNGPFKPSAGYDAYNHSDPFPNDRNRPFGHDGDRNRHRDGPGGYHDPRNSYDLERERDRPMDGYGDHRNRPQNRPPPYHDRDGDWQGRHEWNRYQDRGRPDTPRGCDNDRMQEGDFGRHPWDRSRERDMTEQKPYHGDRERSRDRFTRHDKDRSTERDRRADMDQGGDSDAYKNTSRDMDTTRGNRDDANNRVKDGPGGARGDRERGDGVDGRRDVHVRDGESDVDRQNNGRYNRDRDSDRDRDRWQSRGRGMDQGNDTTRMRDVDSNSERGNGREGMRLSSNRNKRPPATRDKRRRSDSNLLDSGELSGPERHPKSIANFNIRIPKISKRNRSGSDDEPGNYSDGILGAKDITPQTVSPISPHRRYSSYLDGVFDANARSSHGWSRSARRTKRPRVEPGGQRANHDDDVDDADDDADGELAREYGPPHPTRRQRNDRRGSGREEDSAGGERRRSRDRLLVSSDSEAGERGAIGRSKTGEQRRAKKLAMKSTGPRRRNDSSDIISDVLGADIQGARLIAEEPPPPINDAGNAPALDSANGMTSAAEAVLKKSKKSKRKSKKRAKHRSKSKRDKHRDDVNDVSDIVEDRQGVTLTGNAPRDDPSGEGALDSTNPIAATDEAEAVESKKAKRDRKARKRAKRRAKLAGEQPQIVESNDVSDKGPAPPSERSVGGEVNATVIEIRDEPMPDRAGLDKPMPVEGGSNEDKSDDSAEGATSVEDGDGAKSSGKKSSSDFGKKESDDRPLIYLDLTPVFNSLNPIAPSSGALRLKSRIAASARKPKTRATNPSKSASVENVTNVDSTGDEGDDESTAMEVSKVLDEEMEDLEQQLSVFKFSEKKAEQATEGDEDNVVNVDEPNQSQATPGSKREASKPGSNTEDPKPGSNTEAPKLGTNTEEPEPGSNTQEPKPESKQEDTGPKTLSLPPTRRSKSKPVRNPTRRQVRLMIDSDIVEPVESQDASKKKKKSTVIFVANNDNALGEESLRFHACMCGKHEEPEVELDGEQGSIQCGVCGLWSHIKCMRLDKDRLKAFKKAEQQFMCWSCIENMTVRTNDVVQSGGLGGGDVNQTDQVIDVINLDDDDDEQNKGDDEIVAVNKVVGNDSNTNFNNRDSRSNRATASHTRSINWNNQMMAVHPWNRTMEPRSGRRVAVRSKLSEQQTEERSNNLDAIREGVITHPTGEREGWLDQKLGIWW